MKYSLNETINDDKYFERCCHLAQLSRETIEESLNVYFESSFLQFFRK